MSNIKTLKNAIILTMDEQDNYFMDGTIIIENNLIKEIGATKDIDLKGDIYDFSNKLIMPGLINTHTHSVSPLFRSMADDMSLMDWLKKVIWPAEKNLTGEMAYYGAILSCLEFINSGITTFVDQYFFADHIFEAVKYSQLRALITPTIFSWPSPETDNVMSQVENYINKYGVSPTDKISTGIGPHAPYSVNERDWNKVMDIAEKNNLLIHTHISETQDENQEIIKKYGLTPTQWLNKLGVFSYPVLAAHSIHLNSEDMNIYETNNVAVTYNPVSNLKLVSGIMPLKEMKKRNIKVSIGTDGAQSNNSLDLFRDLKTGVLIQKNYNQDAEFISSKEALRMATINGAKAIGMEKEIGSLQSGKKADIISLDLQKPNMIPYHKNYIEKLYSLIVYSASASNVSDVMVGGKFLYKDYKYKKLDINLIKEEANKIANYLLNN